MASNRLSVTNYTEDLILNCIRVLQSRRYAMNLHPESNGEFNNEVRPENPVIIITPPSPKDDANDYDTPPMEDYTVNVSPEDVASATNLEVIINLDYQEVNATEAGARAIEEGAGGNGGNYNYLHQQIMPMGIDEYEESLGRINRVDMCIGILLFALWIGVIIITEL